MEYMTPEARAKVERIEQASIDDDARVHLCVTCGAVITPGTTKMHHQWHDRLDAAIAANRPDPRSAFIGG